MYSALKGIQKTSFVSYSQRKKIILFANNETTIEWQLNLNLKSEWWRFVSLNRLSESFLGYVLSFIAFQIFRSNESIQNYVLSNKNPKSAEAIGFRIFQWNNIVGKTILYKLYQNWATMKFNIDIFHLKISHFIRFSSKLIVIDTKYYYIMFPFNGSWIHTLRNNLWSLELCWAFRLFFFSLRISSKLWIPYTKYMRNISSILQSWFWFIVRTKNITFRCRILFHLRQPRNFLRFSFITNILLSQWKFGKRVPHLLYVWAISRLETDDGKHIHICNSIASGYIDC